MAPPLDERPVPITGQVIWTPEFFFFCMSTLASVILLSKRVPADSLAHDLAAMAGSFIAAINAWLTGKARSAASPAQNAVIQTQEAAIVTLTTAAKTADSMLSSMQAALPTVDAPAHPPQ